ncbi:MAG: hypothetical protein E1N59_445 [Puniceicoccaceae bacterium 5H]|nr:MAG: hypothetical protein E1N59_445 [Puniceicoccaceae bacterium 5H]
MKRMRQAPGHILLRGIVGLFLLGVWIALGLACAIFWYYERPQPAAVSRTLRPSITYTRHVIAEPLPQIIHVATIDLQEPTLSWSITQPVTTNRNEQPLQAQTVSAYLERTGAVIAVNGDYFHPGHFNSPFDYAPHSGEPVDVKGFARVDGVTYSYTLEDRPMLVRTPSGTVMEPEVPSDAQTVLSGYPWLVHNGNVLSDSQAPSYWKNREPRTAVGLSQDRRYLYLVVCDGSQPQYAEGLTLPELAAFLHQIGAYQGFNLDGGGSSAMVVDGWFGAHAVNAPIHSYVPGWQRPVGNHLGIFAQ